MRQHERHRQHNQRECTGCGGVDFFHFVFVFSYASRSLAFCFGFCFDALTLFVLEYHKHAPSSALARYVAGANICANICAFDSSAIAGLAFFGALCSG